MAATFFLLYQRFLGISISDISILMFFCLFVFSIPNRVMFFLFILGIYVLPKHDQESSHDTSVVASHVDHVVGIGVLNFPQISSLGQNVVNLFFFPFLERRRTSVSAESS